MGGPAAYRIIDVGVLFKMFKEKRNYLSSPENWDDHWEKLDLDLSNPKDTESFKRLRKRIFAQCWSFESYSWAMWKINSPYGYGVRIKSTVEKLFQSLPYHIQKRYKKDDVIQNVKYFKEDEIKKMIKKIIKNDGIRVKSIVKMFYLKRKAYEFEKEVRLILPKLEWHPGLTLESTAGKKFMYYKWDPCHYIESIYFDSNINEYIFEIFVNKLKKYGFRGVIGKSAINKKPEILKIA
jgi:hypothetical protein